VEIGIAPRNLGAGHSGPRRRFDMLAMDGLGPIHVGVSHMLRTLLLVVAVLWAAGATAAETAMGNSALALASLVADHSPLLSLDDRSVMSQLIHPNPNFSYMPNKTISVEAERVVCRESNVDITERSCELTFGSKKVSVAGRRAHELFATIREVGVEPDGAAGTIFESLSRLQCTIDLDQVKQKAGGGANCTYESGSK
jgi:hypothetical protein